MQIGASLGEDTTIEEDGVFIHVFEISSSIAEEAGNAPKQRRIICEDNYTGYVILDISSRYII